MTPHSARQGNGSGPFPSRRLSVLRGLAGELRQSRGCLAVACSSVGQ